MSLHSGGRFSKKRILFGGAGADCFEEEFEAGAAGAAGGAAAGGGACNRQMFTRHDATKHLKSVKKNLGDSSTGCRDGSCRRGQGHRRRFGALHSKAFLCEEIWIVFQVLQW